MISYELEPLMQELKAQREVYFNTDSCHRLLLPLLNKLLRWLEGWDPVIVKHRDCLRMLIDKFTKDGANGFRAVNLVKKGTKESVLYSWQLDCKVKEEHVWAFPYDQFDEEYPEYVNVAQFIVEEWPDQDEEPVEPERHVIVIPDWEVGDSYCNNFSQYVKPGAASAL